MNLKLKIQAAFREWLLVGGGYLRVRLWNLMSSIKDSPQFQGRQGKPRGHGYSRRD